MKNTLIILYCSLISFTSLFSQTRQVNAPRAIPTDPLRYELPIDAAHSVISFSVGFAGGISTIDGRFDNFEGTIAYENKNNRSSLACDVTIDVSSINTGNKKRDEDLMDRNWFDAANHPKISFKSVSTTKTKDGFMINGDFSMMGIVERITIPFTFQHKDNIVYVFGEPRIAALGTHTIDRTKYNIPKRGFDNMVESLGSRTLSEKVEIKLMIMGRGKGINELIADEVLSTDVTRGIKVYEQLEKDHKGLQSYNFGDRALAGIVDNILTAKENLKALEFSEYAIKRYPQSTSCYFMNGSANEAMGKIKKAIDAYEKCLKINPNAKRAKAALNRLKTDQ